MDRRQGNPTSFWRGSGSIVNVSSTYGRTGGAGASVYAASKHAVEGLTKSAALEAAGSGVRVNVVAPDGLGNLFGRPYALERHRRDQASLPFVSTGKAVQHPGLDRTVFLSSDKASFITGASFLVDGGKTAQ